MSVFVPFLLNISLSNSYGLPADSLDNVAVNITKGLLGIIATLAVLAVVIGAFMYVTSRGNQDQLEKAKKIIIWAVGGIIVASLSWSIVYILSVGILSNTPAEPPAPPNVPGDPHANPPDSHGGMV